MKSYQMYIFDFDDTLANTFQVVSTNHYPELARELNLKVPPIETIKKNWKGNLRNSLRAIFGETISSDLLIDHLNILLTLKPVPAVPDALKILNILKEHKKYIAIVSSRSKEFLIQGIKDSLGLEPGFFDILYSTIDNNMDKPCPGIIPLLRKEYERKTGSPIENSDMVYIGDSLGDYLTVKNIPLDFAAVTNGVCSKDDFISAGLSEDWIFSNLKQVFVPLESHGVVALIRNHEGEYLMIQEGRENNKFYGAWSGPHGRCKDDDILEEESVVRETLEECGISVFPVKKVYTRSADTKIKTVAFWETQAIDRNLLEKSKLDSREVSDAGWFSLEEIKSGKIPLYDGTKDFFDNHR
ncbi:MAG: HAD hydrolase-like protein [bacterium]|nr:HAD hydrolase-like protein [bacterium]